MTLRDSTWTRTDIPPSLVVRPSTAERLLESLSRWAIRTAAELRRRRIAELQRIYETTEIGISEGLRRDIGLPPVHERQDTWNYR
jgi:hypothetical protein